MKKEGRKCERTEIVNEKGRKEGRKKKGERRKFYNHILNHIKFIVFILKSTREKWQVISK